MRRYNKFKLISRFYIYPYFFHKRILKFNRPKWLVAKKKIKYLESQVRDIEFSKFFQENNKSLKFWKFLLKNRKYLKFCKFLKKKKKIFKILSVSKKK